MAIPSLAMIPTGFKDGKLYSVLPESGAGDFSVVRGSGATRVNKDGLIEDVRILSGELITNGDFATDSNWSKGTGWSIADGKASCDGTNTSYLVQAPLLTTSKSYKISFDIVDYTSGSIKYRDNGFVSGQSFSGTGNYVDYVVAGGGQFRLMSENFIGSIDNVSVKEITHDTNIPRLDYTDGGCPVLLTEPQSTNLITYSEDFSQWGTVGSPTLTSSYGVSPDGTQNADRLQMNTGDRLIKNTSTPNVSFSVYAKSNSGLTHTLSMRDGTGSVSYDMVITNEWKRFDVYLNTTMSNVQFRAYEDNIDILMWGAQVEALPYSTSYIPTSGAIATRLADVVSVDLTSFTLTSITETIDGVEQAPITIIPSTYTIPQGRINKITMI